MRAASTSTSSSAPVPLLLAWSRVKAAAWMHYLHPRQTQNKIVPRVITSENFPRVAVPNFRERPATHRRWLAACLLLATASTASAQTLARPGWNASGFNTDPWWKRAVFYEVLGATSASSNASGSAMPLQTNSTTDLKAVTNKLDTLKSFGVDALILPMPATQAPDAALDSFDELISQASNRGIRILLTLRAASVTAELSATARFWLSRGVSGFHLVTPPQTSQQDSQTIVQAVRKITSSTVGGRIVISDLAPNVSNEAPASSVPNHTRQAHITSPTPQETFTGAQLQLDSQLGLPELPSAANLRPLLARSQLDANVILSLHPPAAKPGSPDPYVAMAKAIAAIALTMRPASIIEVDPDLSPQSGVAEPALSDWYRKLIALHHGNATVRSGSVTTLDFDAQNALLWVIRPAPNARLAAPVVVACNLSPSPVKLSLGAAMKSLSLHGFYLRTLLRTDTATGAQDINAVTLPPFGVYIGELRR